MQQILWEVIFKARPFPYKDDWVVIVECNMLFTFYRVHKYLQLRKPVPKADSKLSFARHVFIQCIDFGREKANLNAIQKQFISVRLWQGRPRVSFVASSPLTACVKPLPHPSPPNLPCKRTHYCWIVQVASVCIPCCLLSHVVASCGAKFEAGQTFSHMQTDATLLGQLCWELLANNVASVCTGFNTHYNPLFVTIKPTKLPLLSESGVLSAISFSFFCS